MGGDRGGLNAILMGEGSATAGAKPRSRNDETEGVRGRVLELFDPTCSEMARRKPGAVPAGLSCFEKAIGLKAGTTGLRRSIPSRTDKSKLG